MHLYTGSFIKNLSITTTHITTNSTPNSHTANEKTYDSYKSRISNVCYRPSFTSGKISDEEFERRKLAALKQLSRPFNGDKKLIAESDRNLIPEITKENIEFTEKFLKKFPDHLIYFIIRIINSVNKDNEPVANLLYFTDLYNENINILTYENLLKNTNKDTRQIIEKLLKKDWDTTPKVDFAECVTKESTKFANYLLDLNFPKLKYRCEPHILYTFTEDELNGVCELIYMAKDVLGTEFPTALLDTLNKKIDHDDLEFIKKLYSSEDPDLEEILNNINSQNIQVAKELLSYPDKEELELNPLFDDIAAEELLEMANENNSEFIKKLLKCESSSDNIYDLINLCEDDTVWAIEKLYETPGFDIDIMLTTSSDLSSDGLNYLAIHNPEKRLQELDKLKNMVYTHPEKFLSGTYENIQQVQDTLDQFFSYELSNNNLLMLAGCILDKEAIETLMRQRLNKVPNYLNIIKKLDKSELEMVAGFNKAVNTHGKPFLPKQKLEFLDLIDTYKVNDVDMSRMKAMVATGKVDLAKLNMDLLETILKNLGYTETQISKIPKEKLLMLDADYTSFLAKQLRKNDGKEHLKTVLDMSFFQENFKEELHDTDTSFGLANISTCEEFIKNRFNYANWLTPPQDLNVRFTTEDNNNKMLYQIATLLTEDIEQLRNSNAKGFVNKQLAKYIKNDKFSIPAEYLNNKTRLSSFTENIIKQLNRVWTQAQSHIDDPQKSTSARNTLTILDHLNQRIEDLKNIKDLKGSKKVDITIKMWDRIPQKDLFQGNYSTCCIGMGNANGETMPVYLMHTAFNMIELIDNETGKTIGNALCYFVKKNGNGKPAFVIDNVEINNSFKTSDEAGLDLRNAIKEYAENLVENVTGCNKMPIYLGKSYNDIPDEDLPFSTENISLMGEISPDTDVYMDVFDGWIMDDEQISNTVSVAHLR